MIPARKSKKQPPAATVKSLQYELFSQFVTNDETAVSNTVELWECIPKYFFTPKLVEKLRTSTGHADPYLWDYTYNGIPFRVKIQPALIEQEDGSYKAFFPYITEELVEEALKKILADKRFGVHDPQNLETWVSFTLSKIHRELKARGRTRSRNQIKQAIEVMAGSILTLYKNGKEIWTGSILQDLVTVDREQYLASTDKMHVARLPLFVSGAINELEFRQFNYDRLLSCEDQLTRWIYKLLIHRFRQANIMNEYHFMYTNLERNSGLLLQGRAIDNRRKVKGALDGLVRRGVLISYRTDYRKDERKIVDVKYTVRASLEFVSEQKAANKRSRDNKMRAAQEGLLLTGTE